MAAGKMGLELTEQRRINERICAGRKVKKRGKRNRYNEIR
jgi:hypothetical protein